MSQLRLAVGLPAYGGTVQAEQARMWLEFGNIVGASSERFRLTMVGVVDVNPVDRARNTLVAKAMLHSSDWLLMVDADTWVNANGDDDAGFQLLRMISDADRAKAALVSAAVVRRISKLEDGLQLAVYDDPGDGQYIGKPASWLATQGRALRSVFAVGAACCAINLHRLDEDVMYRFTDKLSEDLDFCRQIREKHGPDAIKLDPRVVTAHLSRPFPLTAAM